MSIATELRPGTRLASYTVESVLGRGAMSVVYAAHDARLGRRVALKVLALDRGGGPRLREGFLGESRLAASVDHPNIIPIYEAGQEGDRFYIAMRLVPGTDLRGLLEREGPLDAERALAIAGQVAGALDAAHARGLLHRDVKPGNILLSSEDGTADHVYLSDFGLAVPGGGTMAVQGTGFHGTAAYAAPEQIEGRPGRASDLYSLACVVFECLTGEPPFRDARLLALLWAHVNDEPPRLSERRPDSPPAADAALASGLAKEPADRPGSCSAFVDDVRCAFGLAGAKRSRKRLALALAALVAVTALATGLLAPLVRGTPSPANAEPDGAPKVWVIAGSGERGSSGDGGPGGDATLSDPLSVAADRVGNVYVSEASAYRVRRVGTDGIVATVAGTGESGYSGDGGPAVDAEVGEVELAAGPAGELYLVDYWAPTVRRIERDGTIATIAGTGIAGVLGEEPTTISERLCGRPLSPTLDREGRVYVVCETAHRVIRIEADGTFTTIAGTDEPGYSGDGGPATEASLNRPGGVAVDRHGNVYIADELNHRIRRVDPAGIITTVAGTGRPGLSDDGWRATGVEIWYPSDVEVDHAGNVYFIERALHRVRKVDTEGMLRTHVGTGTQGRAEDGMTAATAPLSLPVDLTVGPDGTVYVAEQGNHRVVRVAPEAN